MTHLIDSVEIHADGSEWSGRIILPDGPRPPAAEIMVLARSERASVVLAAGALKAGDLIMLGSIVYSEARDPANRLVYLVLMSPCGRLGGIQYACRMLREARRHAAVICYLQEVAFGPALLLANHCDLAFAHPATQIGWLDCQTAGGECDAVALVDLLDALVRARPPVSIDTYLRLAASSITGEQAEAAGIVGGLKTSIWELANIDPEGAQP